MKKKIVVVEDNSPMYNNELKNTDNGEVPLGLAHINDSHADDCQTEVLIDLVSTWL